MLSLTLMRCTSVAILPLVALVGCASLSGLTGDDAGSDATRAIDAGPETSTKAPDTGSSKDADNVDAHVGDAMARDAGRRSDAGADASTQDTGAPRDAANDGDARQAVFETIRIASGYTMPVADSTGNAWSADTDVIGGTPNVTSHTVAGTTSPVLYEGQRYGQSATSFAYTFSIQPGKYNVLLKFTENNFGAPGARLFDVTLNGAAVLTNFDIFQTAGGMWIAVDKTFLVDVQSSGLTIAFLPGTADNPKIDALEVSLAATGDAGL
jgi:hypothetical protein